MWCQSIIPFAPAVAGVLLIAGCSGAASAGGAIASNRADAGDSDANPESGAGAADGGGTAATDSGSLPTTDAGLPAPMGCPQLRTDVNASTRVAVHLESLGWDALAVQLEFTADDRAVIGTANGLQVANVHASASDWNWSTFTNITAQIDALLVTSAAIHAGGDGLTGVYQVSLDGTSAQIDSVEGHVSVISLAYDATDGDPIIAGTRSGDVFRITGPTTHAGGHLTNVCGVTALKVESNTPATVIANGCVGELMDSTDNGETFPTKRTGGGFVYRNLRHWIGGTAATLLVASEGSSATCSGVYSCDSSCSNPTLLGNSDLMDGYIVTNGNMGSFGCHLTQRDDVILGGSASELWVSVNGGANFRLVENALGCGSDSRQLRDIEIRDEHVYLATETGVFRFALADVSE